MAALASIPCPAPGCLERLTVAASKLDVGALDGKPFVRLVLDDDAQRHLRDIHHVS